MCDNLKLWSRWREKRGVIQRQSAGDGFSVTLLPLPESKPSQSTRIQSRSIILATGVKDILPTHIPGLLECWGKSVIHCPYCHGYEFHGKKTALWMSLNNIRQMAQILRTTFTDQLRVVGTKEWDSDHVDADALRSELEQRGVKVHSESIVQIKHASDGIIRSILLEDGLEIPMDCVYIRPPMEQNFRLEQLELSSSEQLIMDDKGYIQVDPDTQKTSVEGIMACGDCTTPNRAVSIAIAGGTRAAKMLNYELAMDDWHNWGSVE